MALEPTPEERQQRAFDILKHQARAAHGEGDGLRVGHLCEIALQEVRRLIDRQELLLTIRDIQWAFVFQLYWLLHGYAIQFTRQALQQVPRTSETDNAIFKILDAYAFFIEQPLMGPDKALKLLKELPISALGDKITPESTEVAVHLVELAWYHSVSTDGWQEVVQLWIQSGPTWLALLLKPVQERLGVQTRLTVPSKRKPPFHTSAAAEISNMSCLAELWLLHLYGRTDAILQRIKEIAPKVNPDDNQWRLIADFWHVNPPLSVHSPGDAQGVWLARRRQMTTAFPALVFNDRRELRIGELLGEIYRRGEEGLASYRWQVLQLAMLHELAALRIWDYGMWREAVRAQSETLLEAAKWMHDQPGWSAQGLVLGVRAISLGSAAKDSLVRSAIDHVEFAPQEILTGLSSDLFSTYPRQKHTASGLLDEVGDLVPPTLWPEFATWTATYAQESRENITSGLKLNPLKPWADILPLVSEDSSIWAVLKPEVIRLAQIKHCWQGDDRGVLWAWLMSSPLDAAQEVAEAMVSLSSVELGDSFFRADLLTSFERERPQVRKLVTRELAGRAQLPEERLLLARHLHDPTVGSIEQEVRSKTIRAVRDALKQAVPREGSTTFSFGPLILGMALLHDWPKENEPLLREIVTAVNSPGVLRNWIPTLLNWIQVFVAYGPGEFATLVQPSVGSWVEQLPLGREVPADTYGPFSIIQMRGIGSDDVSAAVGWICLQLLRKLNRAAHAEVQSWIQNTLLAGYEKTMPIAFYVAIVISTQTTGECHISALAAADAILAFLRLRMKDSQAAAMSLASALAHVAHTLRNEGSDTVDWKSNGAKATLKWLSNFLESHSPVLASACNPHLRGQLALLLWNMNRNELLPPSLTRMLEQLGTDRRAQVRLNAKGGEWELLRTRKTA